MLAQKVRATSLPVGVSVGASIDGLAAIHQPDCAAAIWQRRQLTLVEPWLCDLAPEQLPSGRVVLRADRVREAVALLCDAAATPAGPEQEALVEDISGLADTFAKIMDATYLRLRLDAVSTNACRRFHVDSLTARLICTYRGTGTQFGTATKGADPVEIHTLPTGTPIVLRGTLWPTETETGLLHRSPPIEGSGETRLLLVLDPIFDLEDQG